MSLRRRTALSVSCGVLIVTVGIIWPRVGGVPLSRWICVYPSTWPGYLIPTSVARMLPDLMVGLFGLIAAIVFWALVVFVIVSIASRRRSHHVVA